jgi:hypothetical protein
MRSAIPVGFAACTVELSFVGSSSAVAVAVAAAECTAATLA